MRWRLTRRPFPVVLIVTGILVGGVAYGHYAYTKSQSRRIKVVSCLRGMSAAIQQVNQLNATWDALREGGKVIVMRHCQTQPGEEDSPNLDLADRSTQRNLSEEGRSQAAALAEAFGDRRVKVGRVITSQYARCAETGELAFGRVDERLADLNSLSSDQRTAGNQYVALRTLINNWQGPDNLVIVTHSSNLDFILRRGLGPGDMIVYKPLVSDASFVGVLPIAQATASATQPATLPATQPVSDGSPRAE